MNKAISVNNTYLKIVLKSAFAQGMEYGHETLGRTISGHPLTDEERKKAREKYLSDLEKEFLLKEEGGK